VVPGPRTHYLEWSPTRSGILTSLVSTSSAADAQAGAIYSWSVRSNDEAHELRQALAASPPDAGSGPPSPSPSPLSRAHESDSGPVQAAQRVDVGDDISSFHLHPSSPGGLLAVSLEETLKEYTLHQGGALAFLPDGSLLCAFDADLWHLGCDHHDAEGDICDMMRDRAARGYVLDAGVNADICGRMGQSDLYRAWVMVSRLLTFDTSTADRNAQADRPEPAGGADKDKARGKEGGEGGEGDASDDARPRWGVWGVHTITETFKDVQSWHIAKPLLRTGGDSFIQRGHASLAVVPPSPLRRDATSGSLDSLRSDDSSSRTPTALSRSRLSSEGNGNNSSLRAAGQGNMMVDVYISEARRRILHICEYDFGEAERYDDDGDFEGSEALEKRVTRLDRKHDHAHAAFTRMLQVDLSSALECLYKGAGYEHDGGAAGGGGDGASCAMAAIAMAGAVHAEADSAVWRRSYMHLVKSCTVRPCRHGAMLPCLSLRPGLAASTRSVESRCPCTTIWPCVAACCLLPAGGIAMDVRPTHGCDVRGMAPRRCPTSVPASTSLPGNSRLCCRTRTLRWPTGWRAQRAS